MIFEFFSTVCISYLLVTLYVLSCSFECSHELRHVADLFVLVSSVHGTVAHAADLDVWIRSSFVLLVQIFFGVNEWISSDMLSCRSISLCSTLSGSSRVTVVCYFSLFLFDSVHLVCWSQLMYQILRIYLLLIFSDFMLSPQSSWIDSKSILYFKICQHHYEGICDAWDMIFSTTSSENCGRMQASVEVRICYRFIFRKRSEVRRCMKRQIINQNLYS